MTDLLTIAKKRRVLNVFATTLWRWEQIGLIQRLPGTRRFTRAEVDRVLQWQSGPRTPEAGTVQNWEGNVSPLTVCKGHAVENGDLFGGGE